MGHTSLPQGALSAVLPGRIVLWDTGAHMLREHVDTVDITQLWCWFRHTPALYTSDGRVARGTISAAIYDTSWLSPLLEHWEANGAADVNWSDLLDAVSPSLPPAYRKQALLLPTDRISASVARLMDVCLSPTSMVEIDASLPLEPHHRKRLRAFATTRALTSTAPMHAQWWCELEYYVRTKRALATATPRLFPMAANIDAVTVRHWELTMCLI